MSLQKDALTFMLSCKSDSGFCLTPQAEPSVYADCFGLFLASSIGSIPYCDQAFLAGAWDRIESSIKVALDEGEWSKSTMQLVCFGLSCGAILDKEVNDQIAGSIIRLLAKTSVKEYLRDTGVWAGAPSSGNMAMFLAVLLQFALRKDGDSWRNDLLEWIDLHLQQMNELGFWGNHSRAYRYFQNGYHQYEVLSYLGVEMERSKIKRGTDLILSLADSDGHFAPYPGGGGCFDYDAVFLLCEFADSSRELETNLARLASSIKASRRNGGSCESIYVRHEALGVRYIKFLKHLRLSQSSGRSERLRQFITLQRPKYDRIQTHWSSYSRAWSEPDLWDTWFRILSLERIERRLKNQSLGVSFLSNIGVGFGEDFSG